MGPDPTEVMTVVASRLVRDGDICFVGIGAPSAACNLARLTHAPNVVLVYESGTLETRPSSLPLSIGDGELCDAALTTVSVPEMFRYWLQGGRISKGFLGGAQIDRYGNINTTVIGPYGQPAVRLPGGGGAPEIAGSCGEVIITARHSPRTLVERVDFVTSFGHGTGGDHRRRVGLTTRGPTRIITDLVVLEAEPGTGEFVVTALHPGVDVDRVRRNTGWDVRFAADLTTTPPPRADELRVLRELVARSPAA